MLSGVVDSFKVIRPTKKWRMDDLHTVPLKSMRQIFKLSSMSSHIFL
jgi:hypothetical protein